MRAISITQFIFLFLSNRKVIVFILSFWSSWEHTWYLWLFLFTTLGYPPMTSDQWLILVAAATKLRVAVESCFSAELSLNGRKALNTVSNFSLNDDWQSLNVRVYCDWGKPLAEFLGDPFPQTVSVLTAHAEQLC